MEFERELGFGLGWMEILGKIGFLFWEIRVERVWDFGVFVDWVSFGFGGLEKFGFGIN